MGKTGNKDFGRGYGLASMCRALSRSILDGGNERTITITLELRVDDESVSGRATDSAGATTEFTGWLGHLGALDALVSESLQPVETDRDLAVSTYPTPRRHT